MLDKLAGLRARLGSLARALGWDPFRRHYKDLVRAVESGREILGRHPLHVQVQTISTCNATCVFCPYPESWHEANPGKMSDELYRSIIDQLACYKIGKFCPYLENEPLLDPKLFERIEYAASKLDFDLVEVSTNASVLSAKMLESIVRVFPRLKNEIRVSFHGINPETFHAVMGLDFRRCLDNVLALVEKAQDHDLTIMIRGAGVARIESDRKPSWFTREEYVRFWQEEFRKRGFKKLPKLQFFSYHDRAGEIDRNEINFKKVIRPDLRGFYCTRFDQWVHFLYTGDLILCCMDYHRKTVLGSMASQSLDEILASEKFRDFARQYLGLTPSPDNFICKRCVSPGG